jgi:hypothetical protein
MERFVNSTLSPNSLKYFPAMKKLLLILSSVLLLGGCGGGQTASVIDVPAETATPRIPQKIPSIPTQKSISPDPALAIPTPKEPSLDMDALMAKINEDIRQPNISAQDIERGWYEGGKGDKKEGTPSTWIWVEKGAHSVWASPYSIDDNASDDTPDRLCRSTAGTYVYSCIDHESTLCQPIPASQCQCPEKTQWVEKQGCILLDDSGKTVPILPTDLQNGWYLGLPDEKKLNTPAHWVWIDNGKQSRWKSPSPSAGDR